MMSLKEQRAVVTGAGSGIGRAIALALGERGASVALVGRRLGPLSDVAERLRLMEVSGHPLPADLAKQDDVRALAVSIERIFSRVDIVVHCAAHIHPEPLQTASPDSFTLQLQTNLIAPLLLTQLLYPLVRLCDGQIVFINSSVGIRARGGVGQYSATKHALKAIADSLRDEVNHEGVRVISVYPGKTATPTQQRLHEQCQRTYNPDQLLDPADVAAMVVAALCLPRTAEVTDIHIRPFAKSD